jgi:hypothetical protein
VGLGDFRKGIEAFKAGMRPGFSSAGIWGDMEKFGRFEGTGEVEGELELPECHIAISAEEHEEVENFEFQLTGPDGQPVGVRRWAAKNFDHSEGLKNLYRIATTKLEAPGLTAQPMPSRKPSRQLG